MGFFETKLPVSPILLYTIFLEYYFIQCVQIIVKFSNFQLNFFFSAHVHSAFFMCGLCGGHKQQRDREEDVSTQ